MHTRVCFRSPRFCAHAWPRKKKGGGRTNDAKRWIRKNCIRFAKVDQYSFRISRSPPRLIPQAESSFHSRNTYLLPTPFPAPSPWPVSLSCASFRINRMQMRSRQWPWRTKKLACSQCRRDASKRVVVENSREFFFFLFVLLLLFLFFSRDEAPTSFASISFHF